MSNKLAAIGKTPLHVYSSARENTTYTFGDQAPKKLGHISYDLNIQQHFLVEFCKTHTDLFEKKGNAVFSFQNTADLSQKPGYFQNIFLRNWWNGKAMKDTSHEKTFSSLIGFFRGKSR